MTAGGPDRRSRASKRVADAARALCAVIPTRPILTRSGTRLLLAVFVALKLALAVWNCETFNGGQYDQQQHELRARGLGLQPNARQYDGPVYYLTAAFVGAKPGARREPSAKVLLLTLRRSNVVYLAIFYLCWLSVIFPALLPDWRSAFVASSILLATPGYQVDAVMVHPDNLLAALVSLAMALWLRLWTKPPATRLCDWATLTLLSLTIGLMGPTRVLGAAALGIMTLFTLILVARGRRVLGWSFFSRAILIACVVLPLSVAWPIFRWEKTRQLGFVGARNYIAMYEPYRKDFDFVHYFGSFYFRELLHTPNRTIGHANRNRPDHFNKYANSFLTLAYSNTWGDHWLYFSGRIYTEHKLWPKRIAFVAALPLALAAPVRLLSSLWWLGASVVSRAQPRRALAGAVPRLFALGILVGGAAAYLYWQTGSGLLPGKNSTIKFLYNAYLYPFAVAMLFLSPLGRRRFNIWAVYVIVLFGLTWDVSMWWPAR